MRDIIYKTVGDEDVRLDIHYPFEKKTGRAPVFYWLHGGGWYASQKEDVPEALFARLRDRGEPGGVGSDLSAPPSRRGGVGSQPDLNQNPNRNEHRRYAQ